MGKLLNDNVVVRLSDEVKKDLREPLAAQGVDVDALPNLFVFCSPRGADEPCMALALIAPSKETASEYLHQRSELANVAAQFDSGQGATSPSSAPRSSTLRSCCSRNRNVPVTFVTGNTGQLNSVSMLNRFVSAKFDAEAGGQALPLDQQPLREITLRSIEPSDVGCQKP